MIFWVQKKSNPIKIEYKDNQLYLNNQRATLRNESEIIVDQFPIADIWKYNRKEKTIRYALLKELKKRKKVK